jgi:hypothetical protein
MKRFRDTQYFVTENGDIFRKWGDVYKPLKPEINQGYYRVVFSINNQQTRYRVNRLVAECYIPNPENKPVVNHMDTNKLNNHYTNLEWSTDRENKDHAIENGLYPRGEENPKNILSTEQVTWIRQNYKKGDKQFGSRPLSRRFNVSKGCIDGIIHKRNWKHLIPNQPS